MNDIYNVINGYNKRLNSFSVYIKGQPNLLNQLNEATHFLKLDASILERYYVIKNQMKFSNILCPRCNIKPKLFKNATDGYMVTCGDNICQTAKKFDIHAEQEIGDTIENVLDKMNYYHSIQELRSFLVFIRYKGRKELLEQYTSYLPINTSTSERIYVLLNNYTDIPKCSCGKDKRFHKMDKGYFATCGDSNCKVSSKVKSYKSTCLDKYGSENHMICEVIKEKIKQSTLTKFDGCRNRHQYEIHIAYKNNPLIKEIKETSLICICKTTGQEYEISKGLYNVRLRLGMDVSLITKPYNSIDSCSKTEKELFDYVNSVSINEVSSGVRNLIKNENTNNYLELDMYIHKSNLAIELNGVYWHSEFRKSMYYHTDKTEKCEDLNIQLLHIWEDDWNYKKDIIKSIVKSKLGLNDRIYARKCTLSTVSHNDMKDFLNENHLQGYVQAKYRYGLYYNNELVSLMTFGQARNSSGNTELLRFCNKKGINVIGGASKLFTRFINEESPDKIISYANRDISDGNLYDKLGFNFVKYTSPSYYWVVDGIRQNRFKYRKSELVKQGYDPEMTEIEIMHTLGYYRTFDSGNLVYEWIK